MTKHFLKTFLLFAGMILIGLVGVYFISYFSGEEIGNNVTNQVQTP